MKKFEVVGCLFFWRITDNGFLEAATGLGEVCVWWKIYNKLVCFMAIDRLETRFLLLHGIVFWLCHGGCRASGKCIYDKKLFVVHPFFRCDFFSGTSMLFDSLRPPCILFFWFSVPKDSQNSNWGAWGDFQKPVAWFDPRSKPLQWRFYFSFVLACVIVGVVLSMSHCWFGKNLVTIAPVTTLRCIINSKLS